MAGEAVEAAVIMAAMAVNVAGGTVTFSGSAGAPKAQPLRLKAISKTTTKSGNKVERKFIADIPAIVAANVKKLLAEC